MLRRDFETILEEHLLSNSNRMMIIEGARQVGKSYLIRDVGKRLFKNFIEINMEVDKLSKRIFAEARTTEDFYFALSLAVGERANITESTLVFIDEIQAYDHLLTLVKFLMDEGRYTYVASGSQLGIALKSVQSLPVGSIRIERMYPLDFEEFLWANNVGEEAIESMRQSFLNRESLSESLHETMMDYFRKYLLIGGLPRCVQQFIDNHNVSEVRRIQREVHRLYSIDATKYESDNNRRLKIGKIYDMVPSVLENKKKRIVAKNVEGKDWKRFEHYLDEFDYLISSGVTLGVQAVSTPRFPLVENTSKNLLKLYINDVGMLSGLFYGNRVQAVLNDEESINLGSVYETVVAQELAAHGYKLFYYDNKANGEVDYLIDDMENLSNLPIEVKSGKDYARHTALNKFLNNPDYNIRQAIVFSNSRVVRQKNGITYLPIYYVMFLKRDVEGDVIL